MTEILLEEYSFISPTRRGFSSVGGLYNIFLLYGT
jgi:hypothetical protein